MTTAPLPTLYWDSVGEVTVLCLHAAENEALLIGRSYGGPATYHDGVHK